MHEYVSYISVSYQRKYSFIRQSTDIIDISQVFKMKYLFYDSRSTSINWYRYIV